TTVTRWVWNGNVPLHQWKQRREYSVMEDRWDTDTERRDMTVWLFDEESFVPMAMIKEGRSYSILTDQLGTPTEAYDAEGNEVWSRVLDMDGNVIEETGNKGMVPFLFQGQYYDRETGLAYNRFRYYSPQMGMYVSQDPIGLAGGILNLYGYVDDTNYFVDILGLWGGKKGQHTATVSVYDKDGNLILTKVFTSGNMTPAERSLGFPKSTLATHTEARAVAQISLSAGQRMEIVGKYPPCNSCKGKMNQAVEATGASITYYWTDEQSGKRKEWKAGYR
ncbi:RHS repeat protein, partial [Phocaeicola vulgatus]|uniref:RHS repeat-associated core domain-containing protein n=1 Tax=Phocaeicola vulgatus TaxID=821 RepID=UPI00293F4DB7